MIPYFRWCRQYPSVKKTEVYFEKISCLSGKSGCDCRFVFCPVRSIQRNSVRPRAISRIRNTRVAPPHLPRSDPRACNRLFFHELLFLALRRVRHGSWHACNAHRCDRHVPFASQTVTHSPAFNRSTLACAAFSPVRTRNLAPGAASGAKNFGIAPSCLSHRRSFCIIADPRPMRKRKCHPEKKSRKF